LRKLRSLPKLKRELDKWFSQYIRLKHADTTGGVRCFTCSKLHHWKDIQNGHFQSRKFLATRFDEGNCRPQCVSCNIYNYGEQYKFAVKLGATKAAEMQRKARTTAKWMRIDYEEKISYYKQIVNKLLIRLG